MKTRSFALPVVLVAAIASQQSPPSAMAQTGSPPPATGLVAPAAATVSPGLGEVDIVFRGLIAFVPLSKKKEDGLKSIFMKPKGAEHFPFMTIDSGSVHGSNTSESDQIVSGSDGRGLAVWSFKEAKLDTANIVQKTMSYNDDKLQLNEKDPTKLRWVPFMDDIIASPGPYDPTELGKAAATADWTVGDVTPEFDLDAHRTELWTIGDRQGAAIADAVRLRVKLADPGKPLILKIKRSGWEDVPVNGGTTIQFSAFPKMIPKAPADDMKHFTHFYDLRTKDKGKGPTPKRAVPPTPNPVRCAPVIYPVVE